MQISLGHYQNDQIKLLPSKLVATNPIDLPEMKTMFCVFTILYISFY